jgi:hypothetical protein
MSEYMIFCQGEELWSAEGIGYQKNTMAFNKPSTRERIKEIYNIATDLDFKYNNTIGWTESWKLVTNWGCITSLPEYDEEIMKGITGLDSIPFNS